MSRSRVDFSFLSSWHGMDQISLGEQPVSVRCRVKIIYVHARNQKSPAHSSCFAPTPLLSIAARASRPGIPTAGFGGGRSEAYGARMASNS
jgi:hypothetical protein